MALDQHPPPPPPPPLVARRIVSKSTGGASSISASAFSSRSAGGKGGRPPEPILGPGNLRCPRPRRRGRTARAFLAQAGLALALSCRTASPPHAHIVSWRTLSRPRPPRSSPPSSSRSGYSRAHGEAEPVVVFQPAPGLGRAVVAGGGAAEDFAARSSRRAPGRNTGSSRDAVASVAWRMAMASSMVSRKRVVASAGAAAWPDAPFTENQGPRSARLKTARRRVGKRQQGEAARDQPPGPASRPRRSVAQPESAGEDQSGRPGPHPPQLAREVVTAAQRAIDRDHGRRTRRRGDRAVERQDREQGTGRPRQPGIRLQEHARGQGRQRRHQDTGQTASSSGRAVPGGGAADLQDMDRPAEPPRPSASRGPDLAIVGPVEDSQGVTSTRNADSAPSATPASLRHAQPLRPGNRAAPGTTQSGRGIGRGRPEPLRLDILHAPGGEAQGSPRSERPTESHENRPVAPRRPV